MEEEKGSWIKMKCGLCSVRMNLQIQVVKKANLKQAINVRCSKCLEKELKSEINRTQMRLFEIEL